MTRRQQWFFLNGSSGVFPSTYCFPIKLLFYSTVPFYMITLSSCWCFYTHWFWCTTELREAALSEVIYCNKNPLWENSVSNFVLSHRMTALPHILPIQMEDMKALLLELLNLVTAAASAPSVCIRSAPPLWQCKNLSGLAFLSAFSSSSKDKFLCCCAQVLPMIFIFF